MRQQDVFKKVGNILNELVEQYEYLKAQSDHINDLELELFAANAHFLTDHLEILRKLNEHITKSLPPHGETALPAHEEPALPAHEELPVNTQPAIEPIADYFQDVSSEIDPTLFVKPAEPEIPTEPQPAFTSDVTILPGVFHFEPPVKEEKPEENTFAFQHHSETETEQHTEKDHTGSFEDYTQPQEEDTHEHGNFDVVTNAEPAITEDVTSPDSYAAQSEEPEQVQESFITPVAAAPVPETGTPYTHFRIEQPEETEQPINEEPAIHEEEAQQPSLFETATSEHQQQPIKTYTEPVYPHDEVPAALVEEEHIHQPLYTPQEPEQPVANIDLGSADDNDRFSFIRSSEPEIPHQNLEINETKAWESEPEEHTSPVIPQPVTEQTPVTETSTAQQFSYSSPAVSHESAEVKPSELEKPMTLNERLSAQRTAANTASSFTAAPAASQAPVKDLKSAITLNDKMLFVRDLFNGYSLAYSEAIEILNRFNNFEDANRFLTANYVDKNNWAAKQSTADKFYDFLKRRFAN